MADDNAIPLDDAGRRTLKVGDVVRTCYGYTREVFGAPFNLTFGVPKIPLRGDEDGYPLEWITHLVRADPRDVWQLVLADMEARRKIGIERYGKPVTPDASEDWLQHLTEEIYDAAVYLKAHRIEVAALRSKLADATAIVAELTLCITDKHNWCAAHMHDAPCPVERLRKALVA